MINNIREVIDDVRKGEFDDMPNLAKLILQGEVFTVKVAIRQPDGSVKYGHAIDFESNYKLIQDNEEFIYHARCLVNELQDYGMFYCDNSKPN